MKLATTAVLYNGDWYLRVIPGKKLFNSTLIHEVVNRGDVFAMRIRDQLLTILPGEFVPITAHTVIDIYSQSLPQLGQLELVL